MREFNDFNWSEVARWLGACLLAHDRKRRQVEVMLPGPEAKGGGWLAITDNGGEVNLFRHARVGPSIGYWHTDFDVGEATLATRIYQALQGGPIDWATNWDEELRANPKKRKGKYAGGQVNADMPAPKPPHRWVDEEQCDVCGERYKDFHPGIGYDEGNAAVREANTERTALVAGTSGGFRSRGPILWAMRVLKLQEWYQRHEACGEYGGKEIPQETVRGCLIDGDKAACADLDMWDAFEKGALFNPRGAPDQVRIGRRVVVSRTAIQTWVQDLYPHGREPDPENAELLRRHGYKLPPWPGGYDGTYGRGKLVGTITADLGQPWPHAPDHYVAVRWDDGVVTQEDVHFLKDAEGTRTRANPGKGKSADTYTRTHWGLNPEEEIEIDDDDLPSHLVAMGNLQEIKVDDGKGTKFEVNFERSPAPTWLAFSPGEDQRLYCVLPPELLRETRKELVVDGGRWYRLGQLAEHAPGRQNGWDYPDVAVQCLGWATHVVYLTEKKGDGVSSYIHTLGEETGKRPLLAVDRQGRLWFAGGNYRVPAPGITD